MTGSVAQHHVGLHQGGGQVVPGPRIHGAAAGGLELAGVRRGAGRLDGGHAFGVEGDGQLLGLLEGAVDHRQVPDVVLQEVARRQGARLAGAHQHGALLAQVIEELAGQLDGGEGHAHRTLADLGLGAHPLAGAEGALEGPQQAGARFLAGPRQAVGVLELAGDLGLADHHALEARRHAVQVLDGLDALQVPRVVGEEQLRVGADAGQRLAQHGLDAVAGRDLAVDLGAVARGDRQHGHAALGLGQRLHQGHRVRLVQVGALAHLRRGVAVVDGHRKQRCGPAHRPPPACSEQVQAWVTAMGHISETWAFSCRCRKSWKLGTKCCTRPMVTITTT